MKNVDYHGVNRNFASLSLKDLLAARDQYHFHLMNKANVVGTAVGRYLIRKDDPWPDEHHTRMMKDGDRKPPTKKERTFENSEVRDYSWPCVLVLVDKWVENFSTAPGPDPHPEQLVPKTIYLPDGRMVPVCIVGVKPAPQQSPLPRWAWPGTRLSPGAPVLIEHQQVPRIASIGCLVSDGHTTYAITNRHVSGAPGELVYTWRRGRQRRIGRVTDKQLTRVRFEDVYPDYLGRRTYLNADVGLIELDDLTAWTSDIFDLGPVGELLDLHEANLGFELIEARVRAHGAASGTLEGAIKGLFYRYKSVGGYDYVADFLIAPAAGGQSTQEGDSGTVWHLQTNQGLLPFGVEWGAQALASSEGGRFNFALATSLTNICKLLDVELVHDIDSGASPTWGQMGHYTIGAFATTAVQSTKLAKLMQANAERISFTGSGLTPKNIKAANKAAPKNASIVPLADVPDLIWKHLPKFVKGGRDTTGGRSRSSGPEHPTHFADIDEPNPKQGNQTLLEACIDAPNKVTVEFWQQFYTDCGHKTSDKRGLLPFRVWQFFDAMVDALAAKDLDRFVCAAGLVSHYVGDACQPLHASMFSNGYTDQPKTEQVTHKTGPKAGTVEDKSSHVGDGVHESYETHMIDRKSKEIVAQLPGVLKKWPSKVQRMTTGQEVAI